MSNKDYKIGFDFDGVLLDIVPLQVWLAIQPPWYLRVTPVDVARGVLRERLEFNGTYEEFQMRLFGDLTKNGLPFPHMKEVLFSLPEKPILISARRGRNIEPAIHWLQAHDLLSAFADMHFVSQSAQKEAMCKKLGIRTYVDDNTWILDLLESVHTRILFDPYNAAAKSSYFRCRTWPLLQQFLVREHT